MSYFKKYTKFNHNAQQLARFQMRHHFCVESVQEYFLGGRVLDIASHDGRWAYAYAEAGASQVIGIEGRPGLVSEFEKFPKTDFKHKVTIHCGDAVAFLEKCVKNNEKFDFVSLLGFYYHTMEHYKIMMLISKLEANTVVVDGEFINAKNPFIQMVLEDTGKSSNAIPKFENQKKDVIGIPSTIAMERLANVFNYQIVWASWEEVPFDNRAGVGDYFRKGKKCRKTCYLIKSC